MGAGTTWEIAIKRAQGRLEDGPDDLLEEIRQNAFLPLPILVEHTVRAAGAPPDPRETPSTGCSSPRPNSRA